MDKVGIVLAGGRGVRLAPATDLTPEPLIDVAGRTMIDRVIDQLGLDKVVVAAGYKREQFEEHFADHPDVVCSIEIEPLGTGGALRVAHKKLVEMGWDCEHVVVTNGDSWLDVTGEVMLTVHKSMFGKVTIACVAVSNAYEYGKVLSNKRGRVLGFFEKGISGYGLVNAGVYVFDRDVFDILPQRKCSLEHDVFPWLIESGLVFSTLVEFARLIDIGTPERLTYARRFFGSR